MRGHRRFTTIAMMLLLAGCGEAKDSAPADGPSASAAAPEDPATISFEGYDIVVAVVDGLRADRAADPAVAPFLGELAREGLSFTHAYANSSHVLQSLASFFTGRLPTRGGTIGVYEAEPPDASTTLAQYFQQEGYYTGLLANHPAIQGKGFTKGFEEVEVARVGQALDDGALVKRAVEFLEDAGDDRIFLYVHFAGPLASKLYRSGEAGAAAPYSVRELGKDYQFSAEHPMDAARVEATIAEYDASVRTADAQVRALAEALRTAGRAEKTLLVVTALHGFELFEHGYLGAGWTLYGESLRVPLIFHAPAAVLPTESGFEPSLVDVVPTILTLANMEFDAASLDGACLVRPGVRDLPALPRIAELVIPERCIVRSASLGGWTYIAASMWAEPKDRFAVAEAHRDTANAYLDGSRSMPPLWGDPVRETLMLGDEEMNPAEHEQARAPLSMALEEYRQRCEQSGIAPRMAVKSVKTVDESQIENLESLGYL